VGLDRNKSLLTLEVYATLVFVIRQRRRPRINSVNSFTSDDSSMPLPEEIADLTRLWATMSHKNRKALLVFAHMQAAATTPSTPFATPRLH
jgi:hypothetical protein